MINKNYLLIKFSFIDCESLVRKMLVLEPTKRYTIPQIKRHRWMIGTIDYVCPIVTTTPSALQEPNDRILRLMLSLGINTTRTKDVSLSDIIERKSTLIIIFRLP